MLRLPTPAVEKDDRNDKDRSVACFLDFYEVLQGIVSHMDRTAVIAAFADQGEHPGFASPDLFTVVSSGIGVRETPMAQQIAAVAQEGLERIPSGLPNVRMLVEHK